MLEAIDAEVKEVQALIERDQRWEERVVRREDIVDLKDTFATTRTLEVADDSELMHGVMVVNPEQESEVATVSHSVGGLALVGAEVHEERLSLLLESRHRP